MSGSSRRIVRRSTTPRRSGHSARPPVAFWHSTNGPPENPLGFPRLSPLIRSPPSHETSSDWIRSGPSSHAAERLSTPRRTASLETRSGAATASRRAAPTTMSAIHAARLASFVFMRLLPRCRLSDVAWRSFSSHDEACASGRQRPQTPSPAAPARDRRRLEGAGGRPLAIRREGDKIAARDTEREVNALSEMPPVPEPELAPRAAPARSLSRSLIADVVKFAIFFAILYLYVMQVSVVRGQSMEPSFHDGDRLVVDKLTYLVSDVRRFDVVVLRAPSSNGMDFIKRVVGLPGETVEIRDGHLYVGDVLIEEDFALTRDYKHYGPYVVPADEYFVLGDNRPYSNDSRTFSFIRRDAIRGKIRLRFWPLDSFEFFP
jgi:signal peptidase I